MARCCYPKKGEEDFKTFHLQLHLFNILSYQRFSALLSNFIARTAPVLQCESSGMVPGSWSFLALCCCWSGALHRLVLCMQKSWNERELQSLSLWVGYILSIFVSCAYALVSSACAKCVFSTGILPCVWFFIFFFKCYAVHPNMSECFPLLKEGRVKPTHPDLRADFPIIFSEIVAEYFSYLELFSKIKRESLKSSLNPSYKVVKIFLILFKRLCAAKKQVVENSSKFF